MRKILIMAALLFIGGIQSFGCSFIEKPDIFLERVINKIKKENKTNDIFCDIDGLKVAYYLVENEDYNLNLGISINVDEKTTNDNFKNNFYFKLKEYNNFFKTIDKSNLGNLPLPDKEVLRFFGKIANTEQFFFIGKYEYDRKTDKYTMLANSTMKDFLDQLDLFKGMQVKYVEFDLNEMYLKTY
mgnify:FL=1